MFDRIRKIFAPPREVGSDPNRSEGTTEETPDNRSPKVLLDGAYRLHHSDDVPRFTQLAEEAFPEVAGRITCFASDWMGSQFATDEARVINGERQILLLEPGTGEVLEIPAGLDTFHDDLLLREPDAVATLNFYRLWLKSGGEPPRYNQCVGYRRPLFLGGVDEVDNLETSDFEVYWSICGQLLTQIKGLPAGTPIKNVTIDD